VIFSPISSVFEAHFPKPPTPMMLASKLRAVSLQAASIELVKSEPPNSIFLKNFPPKFLFAIFFQKLKKSYYL
jgi:hypothetical protein